MDYKSLIQYLKESCFIDDPTMVEDSMFLALKDEELTQMLEVSYSKIRTTLSHLEEEDTLYAIVLLSKQEVYSRLALKYAIQFDISGEGSLSKSQRFDHFARLLEMAKDEWDRYVKDQEAQVDVSNTDSYSSLAKGRIFMDRHYFKSQNVMFHNKPQIQGKVDNQTKTTIELSWKVKRINRLRDILVYLGESPVYDKYDNTITGEVVFKTTDLHRNGCRIKDLQPNTTYYVALVISECNGLQGVHELVVTTEGDEEECPI